MAGRSNAVDCGVLEALERPELVADLFQVAALFQVFDSGCPEGRMRSMVGSWKHWKDPKLSLTPSKVSILEVRKVECD